MYSEATRQDSRNNVPYAYVGIIGVDAPCTILYRNKLLHTNPPSTFYLKNLRTTVVAQFRSSHETQVLTAGGCLRSLRPKSLSPPPYQARWSIPPAKPPPDNTTCRRRRPRPLLPSPPPLQGDASRGFENLNFRTSDRS